MTDVVITGLGTICSAGNNTAEFTEQLFAPKAEYHSTFTNVDYENSHATIAQVNNYQADLYFNTQELKQLDKFSQFGLIATNEAIKQAKLLSNDVDLSRIAVIFGSGIGGQETVEESYYKRFKENKTRAHPFTVPKLIPSAACSQISIKYGITGPSFATSSACSSSGHAISMAYLMLKSGMVDAAIVGGSEACLTEGNFYAWQGLRVLSNEPCQPFATKRSGLTLGEGAGCIVMETENHAKQRNAKILAQLKGVGLSSDAHNMVQPNKLGAIAAMKNALLDAELSSNAINYINAHGSGTYQNDLIESEAIEQIFGHSASQPYVSSTKSLHGHVLGAGSVIESIATILSIEHQKVSPTRNGVDVDEKCNINAVLNEPIACSIEHALCNSFAFGGLNCSLLFQRYHA